MQMQKTEIAQEAGWEEETDDVATSAVPKEQAPTQDAPVPNAPLPNTPIQHTTLLDAEDRVAPNQINTEKPIWRHPIPRTILVVVSTSAIGLGFVSLTEGNGLIHSTQSQVAVAPTPTPKPQISGDDKGELQGQLATIKLQQQMDVLKTKKAQKAERSAAKPPSANSPKPVTAASPPPSLATTAYNPPTQYSRPRVVKPAPVQSIRPQAQPQQQPTAPKDPMETWMAAANIGSYGQISPGNNTQGANSKAAEATTTDGEYQAVNYQANNAPAFNSDWQPSGGIGQAPLSRAVTSNQPNSPVAQSSRVAHSPNSNYQARNYTTSGDSLAVGTRADGKLETPIAWSGDLQNPNQNFLIQLTQPLKGSDGSVVVPKNAYLVARVNTATSAGVIQMSAVSVLSTQNNRTVEQPLPEGAILVLGKGGQPLQAKTTRRESAGNDIGIVLLSGASTAAGLVNQSTSQSTFNSGGGFQTTITNPEPNYLAGFGQGAAQALVQQMQNRNQRARQSIESQPDVFILNQGTSVQVFVNQSVSL